MTVTSAGSGVRWVVPVGWYEAHGVVYVQQNFQERVDDLCKRIVSWRSGEST